MIKTKIVSSLEKAFIDGDIDSFEELSRISVLKGERLSFQLLYTSYDTNGSNIWFRDPSKFALSGSLAPYATVRAVNNVPVTRPLYDTWDDNYLRYDSGLYPDLLYPIMPDEGICICKGKLLSLWIEVNIPEDYEKIGENDIAISLNSSETAAVVENRLTVEIIDAVIEKPDIKFTQWFYTDCLANYYDVPVWSEKHWQIVENFAKVAVKNGINMLLTPTFTPALDTYIGGERLTTQLVKVTKRGDKYSFGFKLLDRWIDMCDRVGIKYFEIAHFFTQWGAKHAPKVMATVDGEYKKIFGWETDALSDEYRTFLRAFVKAFLKHMKKRGDDKRCYFHISDEPKLANLEQYKAARDIVGDLLKDYTIMDALSSYEFWEKGICDLPIPANNHIEPFLEGNVPGLWTYYCCGQCVNVSNRFIAMPSWRNRSIGMQMYKFNIAGFLQWGYNYYNNFRSTATVDPFGDTSAGYWAPAGDAFSVYPAHNGEALESLRIIVFYEALQDMMVMKACEKYYSHEEVVRVIEDVMGAEVRFDLCAMNAKEILTIRERLNEMLKAKI